MPWAIFTNALWDEYKEGYKSGRLQMETLEPRSYIWEPSTLSSEAVCKDQARS